MSKHKKHQDSSEELIKEQSTEKNESLENAEKELSLEEKYMKLEAETSEWKDKYLRSMAEFENFRRRSQQEKADWIRLATEKLALNVCDVVDNFARALAQVSEEHKEDSYIKGFFLIEQQLVNVLSKEGVKKIEALGKEFDPNFHEALAHIPSDMEENTIAAIIQNGYTMHDKIIRPVRVAVSNGTKKPKIEEE